MPIIRTKLGKNVTILHPELVNIFDSVIGSNCKISAFVEIGGAIIGNNCKIQSFAFIPRRIKIGNNVFIGPHVNFLNDKHPPSGGKYWMHTIVEDKVVIGGGATILPGLVLEEGCVIGAGAVVTKNVSAGSVMVGNPARCVV